MLLTSVQRRALRRLHSACEQEGGKKRKKSRERELGTHSEKRSEVSPLSVKMAADSRVKVQLVQGRIRDFLDFPKKGILFR